MIIQDQRSALAWVTLAISPLALLTPTYAIDDLDSTGYGIEVAKHWSIYSNEYFEVLPLVGFRGAYATIDNIGADNTRAEGFQANIYGGVSAYVMNRVEAYIAYDINMGMYDTGDNSGSRYTTNSRFSASGLAFGVNVFF